MSPLQFKIVTKFIEEGISVKRIAAYFSVPENTVRKSLWRAHIHLTRQPKRLKRNAEIVQLYSKRTHSIAELADYFNMSPRGIRYILMKHGVKSNPPSQPLKRYIQ